MESHISSQTFPRLLPKYIAINAARFETAYLLYGCINRYKLYRVNIFCDVVLEELFNELLSNKAYRAS